MPVSVTGPPVEPFGTVPAGTTSGAVTIGAPAVGAFGTVPMGRTRGQRVPFEQVTAMLYLHDGLHAYGPLTKIRGVEWVEELNKPAQVTFEVAADDPAAAHIGPFDVTAGIPARIVKITWWRKGRQIRTVACRIQKLTSQFAVNGRRWIRYEAQPGIMAMLGDAGIYPERDALDPDAVPDQQVNDRILGPNSLSSIGGWYRASLWQPTQGYHYSQETLPARIGQPPMDEFRVHDPYWISLSSPAHTVTNGRVFGFRHEFTTVDPVDIELLPVFDNYGRVVIDDREYVTPDYSTEGGGFLSATPVRGHLEPGDHVYYCEVENAISTGGANPIAHMCICYTLDAHGNRDGILFITEPGSSWKAASGPPVPAWSRALQLRQLMAEGKARDCVGLNHLAVGWGRLLDSRGELFTDIDAAEHIPINQSSLLDVAQGLTETGDVELLEDGVGMRQLAFVRAGKVNTSVVLALGKDAGTLRDYTVTSTAPAFNAGLIRLASGRYTQRKNAASVTAFGRIEAPGLQLGSAQSDHTAVKQADALLAESAHRYVEVTAEAAISATGRGPCPYIDYFPLGDTITGIGVDGEAVAVRSIKVHFDATARPFKATPVLVVDPTVTL